MPEVAAPICHAAADVAGRLEQDVVLRAVHHGVEAAELTSTMPMAAAMGIEAPLAITVPSRPQRAQPKATEGHSGLDHQQVHLLVDLHEGDAPEQGETQRGQVSGHRHRQPDDEGQQEVRCAVLVRVDDARGRLDQSDHADQCADDQIGRPVTAHLAPPHGHGSYASARRRHADFSAPPAAATTSLTIRSTTAAG
ncbi:hypothetical protein [Aeromicrobium sp. UC242_57]|uniref:hypothetical protein n=1 Tax=Aeromicrobium sp. UC242_57 TaxID=3374624 RepID=UPI003797E51E